MRRIRLSPFSLPCHMAKLGLPRLAKPNSPDITAVVCPATEGVLYPPEACIPDDVTSWPAPGHLQLFRQRSVAFFDINPLMYKSGVVLSQVRVPGFFSRTKRPTEPFGPESPVTYDLQWNARGHPCCSPDSRPNTEM